MKKTNFIKKALLTAGAAAVIFTSVAANPVTTYAKGTAFINKKVANVTPTIKSAKRAGGVVTVTVSLPKAKAAKFSKVKKVTVAYGSTNSKKKFEAVKAKAKVTRKGKNQFTFTIGGKELATYKNAYMTVRFDGKSNWSKLVKISGKALKIIYTVKCNTCSWQVKGTDLWALIKQNGKHQEESEAKWLASFGDEEPTFEDCLNANICGGYTYSWSYSYK